MNKGLEALTNLYAKLSCKSSIEEISENLQEYETVRKNLMALEIIKSLPQEEKEILLNAIYTYTKSEEEYDLLKEVLL